MSDPAPSAAHVGSCLGERYDLDRLIARGGMGDVFAATDRVLGRPVAVKVLRGATPTDRGRFDAEIRLLAQLDHPTLVRLYDAGTCEDDAYLVMELVDGPTLAARLRDDGPLAPEEVAAVGADLAAGLASIHERGVVHRDVTPANVLCGPDGRPRLVDLGIARLLGSPRVTAVASTIGTAAYMAPEQVAGEEVTGAADVYSLGLVLLEALTGRAAFEGTAAEVAGARLHRDPDTTSDVPAPWRPLLAAATSRDPLARPPAAVLADRLAALAEGVADDVTAPAPIALAPTPVAGSTATTDPDATALLHAGGATAVLPVVPAPPDALAAPTGAAPAPSAPAAGPDRAGRRRAGWAVALAAVAALVLLGVALAALGGGGDDAPVVPSTSTSTTEARTETTTRRPVVTTAPTTTSPPTTTVVVPTTEVLDVPAPPQDGPQGQPPAGGADGAPVVP